MHLMYEIHKKGMKFKKGGFKFLIIMSNIEESTWTFEAMKMISERKNQQGLRRRKFVASIRKEYDGVVVEARNKK